MYTVHLQPNNILENNSEQDIVVGKKITHLTWSLLKLSTTALHTEPTEEELKNFSLHREQYVN